MIADIVSLTLVLSAGLAIMFAWMAAFTFCVDMIEDDDATPMSRLLGRICAVLTVVGLCAGISTVVFVGSDREPHACPCQEPED